MSVENVAKLVTARAALFGAIAWPVAVVTLGFCFRKEFREIARKFPMFIDRMRKIKLAGLEAELDRVADAAGTEAAGNVTDNEIRVAAKIAVEADDYDLSLANELDKLCLQYDTIRKVFPSGDTRTKSMSRVLVKMRALAPALIGGIDQYKSSPSPGSRLAAVAMMQMNPNSCDIDWLAGRFESEQPFIFYHAALALQNLANGALTSQEWDQLHGAAQRGLEKVESFSGTPDLSTIQVLRTILDQARK